MPPNTSTDARGSARPANGPHRDRSRAAGASGRTPSTGRLRGGAPARCLIVVLLLWLLVGPRLDIGATPLRVEDLVLAGLGVLCVVLGARPRRPGRIATGVLLVVATGLVAAAVASALGAVSPITAALFAVRPLEYWVVHPTVLLLLSTDRHPWRRLLDAVLVLTTVLQSTFAVLQSVLHLPIGFSHASYARAAGLTVGPYELGALSAALLVLWASRRSWLLAAVAAVGLLLSASRISLLGAVVGMAIVLMPLAATFVRAGSLRRVIARVPAALRGDGLSRWRRITRGAAAVALALVIGLGGGLASSPAGQRTVATLTGPVGDRLATTSLVDSWTSGQRAAARLPPLRTSDAYLGTAYDSLGSWVDLTGGASAGAEPSNLVRFFRWNLILDNLDTPQEALLGLGPSFVGPSVDGSYLRSVADAGLLGAAAWLVLVIAVLRRSPRWMVGVTVSFLVAATFIDILYAQRPMVLLWALLALSASRAGRSRRAPFRLRGRVPRRSPAGATG